MPCISPAIQLLFVLWKSCILLLVLSAVFTSISSCLRCLTLLSLSIKSCWLAWYFMDRTKETLTYTSVCISVSLHVYAYIYIYVCLWLRAPLQSICTYHFRVTKDVDIDVHQSPKELVSRATAWLAADVISSLKAHDGASERCEKGAAKDECTAEFSLHVWPYASVYNWVRLSN